MTRKPICPLALERYVRKYPPTLTNGLWSVHTEMQPESRLMPDAVMAVSCASVYRKCDALTLLDALLSQRYAIGHGHWGAFLISEVLEQ